MIRPVFTGSPNASTLVPTSLSYRSLISSPDNAIELIPVQPESTACSARYSSALMPSEAALTRIGRSFETTVTSCPSWARCIAIARIRLSLSPRRMPLGSTV